MTMPKQAMTLTDKRLKQALDACPRPRHRAMLLLSVKAGLRAKEIAGLTWEAVDLDQGYLRLSETKGRKPRTVPLAAVLRDALTACKAETKGPGPVFLNARHEPLTANAVAQWFRDLYARKLGWSGYSSHSGRRTMITKAARKITEAGV